jgi:hypothetical protein
MIANSVCACFCVVVTATFINASPATYRPLLKTGSHGADPTLAFAVFGIVVLAAGFVSAAGAALCYVLAARGGEPRGGPIGRLVSFYGKVAVGMTLILALVAISAFGVALGLQAQPVIN